jgi:hypothetical protein
MIQAAAHYSIRNAEVGSSRVARRAGTIERDQRNGRKEDYCFLTQNEAAAPMSLILSVGVDSTALTGQS